MFSFRQSDAAIVQQTLEGHPEAFEPLVFRYQKKAQAIAHSLGLRLPEVEDAVQEAFLQAFRDLPSLREPASFGPWFLHIVRHVSSKFLRKGGPPANAQPAVGPPRAGAATSEGAQDSLERSDFSEYLWRKVAELPEGVREAIFLYHYEGRAHREVARALGISRGAVKKRLKAGRNQLREKLWRELADCLRDMLPSTRHWRRRAGRVGLLVLGSIPASWAARADPVRTGPTAAADGLRMLAARTSGLIRGVEKGGLLAGKKKLLAWSAVGLFMIFLGGTVWRMTYTPRREPEGALVARSPPPPAARAAAAVGEAPPALHLHTTLEVKEQKSAAEEPPPQEPPGEDPYGSTLVRVIWGDDKTPAAGVRGMVIPWGSPHLYIDERGFVTGPDGAVQVDHLFRGGATVMLDRGGSAGVQVVPGELAETVVEIPPGMNVEGVVVDPDGLPAGGARVWVSYRGHTNWGNEVAVTGPDGSFWLRSIGDDCYIGARAAGYAPSDLRHLKSEAGTSQPLRIRLNGQGGAVVGTVRDPRGEPVAHAKVMVGAEYAHYTLLDDGATGLSGPPDLAFTDSQGRFMSDAVPPGETRIAVRAPGFVALEVWVEVEAGSAVETELALAPGATLTGRVTGAQGQPASGAKMVVGDARDFLSLKVFSSADGSYLLEGLPPGEVEVYAERKGWGRAAAKLTVKGLETLRWDAILAQDREIVGRVLDENGLPLPGFLVLAEEMLGAGGRKATQTKLKADGEGRFRIPELSDLAYRILVFEQDNTLPCFFADGVRPGPEETVIEVERESLSSAFLLGKVLGPGGDPAGRAKVLCFSALAGYRVDFTDQESGAFQSGPLPPGSYRLEVQIQGQQPAVIEVKDLSPREHRDLGLVRLKAGR
jgi:RNA polymerase sigma-70 factor (ECF subfamily)